VLADRGWEPPWRNWHTGAGWLIAVLIVIQIVGAWLRGTHGGPVDPFTRQRRPPEQWPGDHYSMSGRRMVFEYVHKTAGYILLILTVVAVITGLLVADAPRWMPVAMGAWWVMMLAVFVHLQRVGRCIDTYQAIWGLDPELPGNRRRPIGLGVVRRREAEAYLHSQTSEKDGIVLPGFEREEGLGLVEGKTCIVTGGAGSLGLAAVRTLLAEGAKVMLVDLDADRLAHTVRELDTNNAAFVAADVTDAAQTRKYVDETVARFGKVDVLFSNAGNDGPLMPITDYPEDLFDKIMATHVRGCFLSCKYTIPQMNDGGSIIITASIVGVKGVPGNCSYVAAKHALMGLMRCVAREVAARRIRVNSVNPGPVDNVFMRTAEKTMSKLLGRDAGQWFDEQIPLGRHARPEEIAQAVCFLASDRSSYTSGTALMVDGAFCA
jgi:NAD(P)-dependent dehydrogenase (short-subunit alcohol dehydrogenase family)